MAVYQGARAPRTVVIPRGAPAPRVAVPQAPSLPRRRMRTAVRARRGSSRISILLALIVVLFAGAFFSLSQDIRVSATGYEMDRLAAQKMQLDNRVEDLRNELNRLGKAPAIRKQAIDAGMGPLPEPVVITAR
jgi:cell division protein FtsL